MKVSQKINNQIAQLKEGVLFKYQDLNLAPSEYGAATKSIERLIGAGKVQRAAKGLFYKPQQSILGALPPRDDEFLKQYLFKNGQRVAYITGMRLYNNMGLTTQFAFTVTLATPSRLKKQIVGKTKIRAVKTYVEVTDENYPYLGFLDSLKDFNNILDIDRVAAIKILTSQLRQFSKTQVEDIITYALKYPPRVRAFLGALLENIGISTNLTLLKSSYSPLSEFKYYITPKILPTATHWKIK